MRFLGHEYVDNVLTPVFEVDISDAIPTVIDSEDGDTTSPIPASVLDVALGRSSTKPIDEAKLEYLLKVSKCQTKNR